MQNETNSFMDMLKILPGFLIPLIAFLWYRSGRLWKFYYALLKKSKEQYSVNSLDRAAWEKIFTNEVDLLCEDIFGALFNIEIEYLKYYSESKAWMLWGSKSETTNGVEENLDGTRSHKYCRIDITNNQAYVEHKFETEIASHLRYSGLKLLMKSISSRKSIKSRRMRSFELIESEYKTPAPVE